MKFTIVIEDSENSAYGYAKGEFRDEDLKLPREHFAGIFLFPAFSAALSNLPEKSTKS